VTRIVAGVAGGRRLVVPPGTSTRPTSDRAREALFSTAEALLRTLAGRRVLDLYAGSGAVGLEALSRGAAAVLLVDDARPALTALRANVAALGLPGAEVSALPVERLVAGAPADPPYELVFLDPPYALETGAVLAVLADLAGNGWLAPEALVVVERVTRGAALTWPDGYTADRTRRYGEATLWYGRAAGTTH
jgi:16S rRNA (guanine966-N2)-methyltransferase